MTLLSRIFSQGWVICLICACGLLFWTDRARMQRVEYVSGLAGRAAPVDASSPSGYANSQRELIVPERNEGSFHWIAQTQQMFAQGEGRVRHVDYDNAPQGREVNAASPYRWWLGLLAWFDHMISSRPLGLSVEQAALWADPVLHALLLIGGTLFVAWQFGGLAAALLAVGLVAVFPFAAGFLPGAPDSHGLSGACVLLGLLALLAGINGRHAGVNQDDGVGAVRARRRWFLLAGIINGLGVWISVPTLVPMITGVFFGALLATWIASRQAGRISRGNSVAWPWRAWAVSGGTTVLAAYLAEYFPAHLGGWRLESIHPLYGLAWIGAGEVLHRAGAWVRQGRAAWSPRAVLIGGSAVIAVLSVPFVMWKTGGEGFLAMELPWARLTNLPNGTVAASLRAWLVRDGITTTVWATLAPLVVLGLGGWLMLRRTTDLTSRISLAVTSGPVLIALGFASQQLGWWGVLDSALLVFLVAIIACQPDDKPRSNQWLWPAVTLFFAVPGLRQLWPQHAADAGMQLAAREAEELIERHLAHWLAKHAGEKGIVIYAPPLQTTTLAFYGGMRGLGTFAAENRAGLGATLMIAGANTMGEAQARLAAGEVRYIIIPSWDPFFDEFAQRYLDKKFSNRTSLLIRELRGWKLPPWLRAAPYPMPVIRGFEGQSVLVFERVDEQSPAVAAGRLAEYFVEIGELDQAASAAETLRQFPGDIGALAARAQVQMAREDAAGAARTLDEAVSRLSSRADRFLPWDRRVSLAVVLARGGRVDLAREQTRRCVAELSEQKLRSLSTGSLYGLLVLSQSFGIAVTDPKLRELALDLLPADLRSGL